MANVNNTSSYMDADKKEIDEKLAMIDYEYDPVSNRYI